MRFAEAKALARTAGLIALAVWGPGACGPQNAEYLIHIDTDAPLALEPGGVLAPGDARPLFDQLLINANVGCVTDCTRVFAVDRSMFKGDQTQSFGVYSTGWLYADNFVIELYRGAGVDSFGPQAGASIGGTLQLPPLKTASNPVDVYVQLRVADLGTQVCDAAGTGCAMKKLTWSTSPQPKLAPWKPAIPSQCGGRPGSGEVCVPGGAFWLGNMQDSGFEYQKLGAVSAFYIDSTEVTVGAYRASGLATIDSKTGLSSDPQEQDPATARSCTFTAASRGPDADALALDCVSYDRARAYCQKQGKDLPTWLEFEYVAGGLTSQTYPWGRDEPSCADAVWGRSNVTSIQQSSDCAQAGVPLSPLAPKSGLRDRVDLPVGTVYDLAGNVDEWVQDYASATGAPCSAASTLVDFVCTDPAPSMGKRVIKGGAWFASQAALRAAETGYLDPTSIGDGIGFRCARPATL
jgi:formylglycine-generating enzyme required for sulfatase activity